MLLPNARRKIPYCLLSGFIRYIYMRCIFQNENFEAFLCPAMYLCGIHFFDNYIFLKGVTFLYTLIRLLFELNTAQWSLPFQCTWPCQDGLACPLMQQVAGLCPSWVILKTTVELAWRSSSVMECHAMARGLIPGWNYVFIELHVLCKGQ